MSERERESGRPPLFARTLVDDNIQLCRRIYILRKVLSKQISVSSSRWEKEPHLFQKFVR